MIHNLKVSDDINDTSRRSFEKVVRDIGYNRKEASDLIPSSAHHPPDMRLTHYTSNVYLSVCLIPQILVAMRGVTLKVDVSRGSIREGPRISLSSTADTSVSSKPPTSDLGAIFRKKEVKTRSDDLDNKHKHAWYQVNALGKSPRDLGAIFHEQVNTALDDLINKHVDALYKGMTWKQPYRNASAWKDFHTESVLLEDSTNARKINSTSYSKRRSLTPEFHDTIGKLMNSAAAFGLNLQTEGTADGPLLALIREIHQKLDEFDRWEMQDAQEHIGDILEMFCHGSIRIRRISSVKLT
ncbi:hypothetical protein PSTT_13151 [Puccinia striiformis]|uniref:Uncharacterized protein n=1 Tax=Puccinia striiformis TaxID=27350 RepID=A0A2S4UTH1_9BASI|nr:hypothetical protein PSTT_13151 [Puccinia striiformis]